MISAHQGGVVTTVDSRSTHAGTALEWEAIVRTSRGEHVDLVVHGLASVAPQTMHVASAHIAIADLPFASEILFTGKRMADTAAVAQVWSYQLARGTTEAWANGPSGGCLGCHLALASSSRRTRARWSCAMAPRPMMWIVMKSNRPVGPLAHADPLLWAMAFFPERGVASRPFYLPGQNFEIAVIHAPSAPRSMARQYDGSNDSMAIVDPPDGSLDFGMRSFTVGLWVKVDQSQGYFDMPFFKGGLTAGAAGYDFELGTNTWVAGFADTNNLIAVVNPAFGLEVNLLHEWHYLVAQCDRTAAVVRTFLDGAQVEELPFVRGSVDSGYYVRFGDPSYPFHGLLDEIHVYNDAISAVWIATEYANVAKRATFQSILPAELHQ
jgi:Concanavalin A-like lectin/glucanases superfamily